MHPIAFELGALKIHWYGIMTALGFLCALGIMQLRRKHCKMSAGEISDFMFMLIISGVLGARIFYVIQFWDQFRDNLWEIVRIDHGGQVFYGGFLCSIIAIIIYCKRKKLSLVRVMDSSAPGLAFGHAVGRLGCFLNGCCFGAPTSCPIGVVYPEGSLPDRVYHGLALHPIQLYEASGNVILSLILFYSIGKVKPGQTFSLYLIIYGVFRFVNEFFRGDHTDFIMGLTPAQTLGIGIVATGIFFFTYFARTKENVRTDL